MIKLKYPEDSEPSIKAEISEQLIADMKEVHGIDAIAETKAALKATYDSIMNGENP